MDIKPNPNTIVLRVHEKSTVIRNLDSDCATVPGQVPISDVGRRSDGMSRQTLYYRHNRKRSSNNEHRHRRHQHRNVSHETGGHSHNDYPVQRRKRKSSNPSVGGTMCANKNSSKTTAKSYAWKTNEWTECSAVNCFTWNTCKSPIFSVSKRQMIRIPV
jgi:hypothetical protein